MGNGVLYIWWVLSLITVGYLPNCSLSLSNLVGFLFLLLLLFVCIIVITSYDHVSIIFITIAVLFVRFSLPLLVLVLGLHMLVLSGLLVSSTVYV